MAGDPITMSIGMSAIQGIAGGKSASRQAMLQGMQANSQYNDAVARGRLQNDLKNLQKAEQRRVNQEQLLSQAKAAYINTTLNAAVAGEQESLAGRKLAQDYRASRASLSMRGGSGGSVSARGRQFTQQALDAADQLASNSYARSRNQESQLQSVLDAKAPIIMDDTFIPGVKPMIPDPQAAGQNAFIQGAISGAVQGYGFGSEIHRNSLQGTGGAG